MNDISNNRPLIYRVNFPTQNPVPKIKGVNYNDILVCSGSRGLLNSHVVLNCNNFMFLDTGHSVTTINLSHILRAGQNKRQTTFPPNYQTQAPAYQTQAPVYQTQAPTYQTERPSAYQTYQTQAPPTYQTERPSSYQTYQTKAPAYQTQAPIYQTERPSASHQTTIKQELHQQSHNNKFTTKPTLKPNNIESSAEDVACGIPVLGLTQSLVVGGKETSRGQWPW